MTTWLVLPTYNEVENLERMLKAVVGLNLGLKVLVVDDNSPDSTGRIADEMATRLSDVCVVHRTGERGLGTAYLAGFQHALNRGAHAVLTMDCDFSHDPEAIPVVVKALGSADLVIGSRYVKHGTIENWPFSRRLLSASANGFVRLLLKIPVRDCTSGFRLYRREVLEAIPWNRVRSTGYSFLVETLYWASRQRAIRVREVPICFVDRQYGKSKMGLSEALLGAVELLRLRSALWIKGSSGARPTQ
jgi:dolichol-phosphate mannosyltransferase